MIREQSKWSGTYDIYINGKLHETLHNTIMNYALDELVKSLQGITPNLQVKYLALGTANTAITNTDTLLGNEIFRTPISLQTKTSTGEVTTDFVVLKAEAVATIEEIGIFVGTSANASLNTGTLISRILWHHIKTDTEEINFKRIDRMVRG